MLALSNQTRAVPAPPAAARSLAEPRCSRSRDAPDRRKLRGGVGLESSLPADYAHRREVSALRGCACRRDTCSAR